MNAYPLQVNYLKALLCLAATADIRYYLNGVHVALDADGEGRMVATDGHILGVIRWTHAPEDVQPFSIIIPHAVIAAAIKAAGRKPALLMLLRDADRWMLGSDTLGGTVFVPLEGRYPDYVRVTPPKVSGRASPINVELLGRFGDAARAIGATPEAVYIGHNAEAKPNDHGHILGGAALVEISGYPEFIGVAMPMRSGIADIPRARPEWASRLVTGKPREAVAA